VLHSSGISYEWHGKALGGMRKSYADHMQTEEFQAATAALAEREGRVHHVRGKHLLDLAKQIEHPARLL
jgi:hypothetical protein